VQKRLVIAVVSLALGGALSCVRRPPERVSIAVLQGPAVALLFLAEAEGYFAEERVSVELRSFQTGRDALSALIAREVDLAASFTTPVAARAASFPELRVLTTLHTSSRNTRLLARADRGIRTAADLPGKRVALAPNTSAEYFFLRLLAFANVPARAVTIVPLEPNELAPALAEGRVDAVAVWGPVLQNARRAAGVPTVELASDVYTELSMLVTRAEVLDRRREALRRVLRALARAERLLHDRPAAAFEALRPRFAGVDERDLREAWEAVEPGLGLTNLLAGVLDHEGKWLRTKTGFPTTPGAGARLLDGSLLEEIDPEAVTLVGQAGGARR